MTLKKQQILICLICTLMLFCNVGLSTNAISTFTPFLIKERFLTNTQASLIATVRLFVGMLALLGVRKYLNRVGMKIGLTLAFVFSAASFFLFAVATDFYSHCIASAFAGLSYGLGGTVALSIFLHRWFDDNLSTAIGICLGGTGAAIIIAPPIITNLIETFGLKNAFLILGCFILLSAIMALIIICDRKKQTEQVAVNDEKELFISHQGYYALMFAAFTFGIASGPGFSNLSVLFTTVGFESMSVSYLLSMFGISLMASKFLSGVLVDTIGSHKALVVLFTLFLAGGLGCCISFIRVFFFSAVSMLLYGAGMSLASMGTSIFARDISSPALYDKTVQQLQLTVSLGSFCFSATPGIIADATGSYIFAYIMILTFTVCGAMAVMFAYRKIKNT